MTREVIVAGEPVTCHRRIPVIQRAVVTDCRAVARRSETDGATSAPPPGPTGAPRWDYDSRSASCVRRLDAQLAERLAQVVLDGAGADEQPSRDRSVGLPLCGKASDLRLLRGQLVQRVHGPPAGTLTCRLQLEPCPLGERVHSGVSEELVRGSQLLAGIQTPALTPKPFAVEEVGASELHADPCALELADRVHVELIGFIAIAEQRA